MTFSIEFFGNCKIPSPSIFGKSKGLTYLCLSYVKNQIEKRI